MLLLAGVGGDVQRGLTAGFLLATGVWLVVVFAVLRTYSATVGEWAEGFTREALGSRRLGWRVIDDVPMHGWNIDHIAITPAAVLAVETKYRGPTTISRSRHRLDLDAARRSGRYTRLLLQSADIQMPAPVQAILLLWGPGAEVIGGHRYEGDVLVVQGASGGGWRELFLTGGVTEEQGETIERGLLRYREMRDRHRLGLTGDG